MYRSPRPENAATSDEAPIAPIPSAATVHPAHVLTPPPYGGVRSETGLQRRDAAQLRRAGGLGQHHRASMTRQHGDIIGVPMRFGAVDPHHRGDGVVDDQSCAEPVAELGFDEFAFGALGGGELVAVGDEFEEWAGGGVEAVELGVAFLDGCGCG